MGYQFQTGKHQGLVSLHIKINVNMKYYVLATAILGLTACKTENKTAETPAAVNPAMSMEYYGDTIQTADAKSVDETLMGLKTTDSTITSVTGYVTGVCQMKGCWMILSQNPDDTTGFFVKFRDYGFFVPKDLSGSKVTIQGKAYKEITGVDELKHYAEDEGKSAAEIAKITAPKEEMKFMANGVAVIERKK
ncbi:MAG: DUF4920 domain-containing protein [Saprospiraceae bacterium]|jgi:hypothetical protein